MMLNNLTKLCSLAAVLALASGCVSSFATKVSPEVNINDYKTFYVEKRPADDEGVDLAIRDEMNKLGLAATAGPATDRPATVDALVKYEDHWSWDITMYMWSLQIDIHDSSNNALLATGKTTYASLNRESPDYMAREVLTTIFRGKRPTRDGDAEQPNQQASQ